MARQMVSTHTGFSWTVTDAGHRFMVGKSACHDAMAWTDLDNDGCIDLIAIATESGNYEDTDHELVALHVPSGTVGWRALPGEVSKKIALVDGVLVASTNQATQLRGLDPRSGQQLWALTLADQLNEDPFDGDDRAPAIAAVGGSLAAVECKDDSYHLVDVRAGRVVKSGQGHFAPLGAGTAGLVGIVDGRDEHFELWDVVRGRCLMRLHDVSQVRAVPGAGAIAVIYHGPLRPDGPWGVQVHVFDAASLNELGRATLRSQPPALGRRSDDDDDDDDDGERIEVGSGEYNVLGGMMLGGGQLVFGSRYHKGPYVTHLQPGQACVARVVPPPRPGLKFRGLAWAQPALVTAWQKERGTAKISLVGHNPHSFAPVWQADDLGGRELDNVMHVAGGALLAPYNPSPDHQEYDQNGNRCALRHLDPTTGTVVTEYPVEDVDCVEVHGNFLCAAPTYFSGGLPVAYDTARRERVL